MKKSYENLSYGTSHNSGFKSKSFKKAFAIASLLIVVQLSNNACAISTASGWDTQKSVQNRNNVTDYPILKLVSEPASTYDFNLNLLGSSNVFQFDQNTLKLN